MTGVSKDRHRFLDRENRSALLLASIVLFFVMAPLLEDRAGGGLLLTLNLYMTLVAAAGTLAEQRTVFWIALPIAILSMILVLASHYSSAWTLLFANYLVLAAFLMLVSGSLFFYLGQPGQIITRGRILVSVSLYFLLGLTWFALFNLINLIEPGSFAESGAPITGVVHWSTMLYFSLVTLTTLGYGDVTAVRPAARMIATLEAAAGVLYVAITVARLVSARGSSNERER
jgi:hypothetical protein